MITSVFIYNQLFRVDNFSTCPCYKMPSLVSFVFNQGFACPAWIFSQYIGLEQELNRKYCRVCACITFLSRPERGANKQSFLLVKRAERPKVQQQIQPQNPNILQPCYILLKTSEGSDLKGLQPTPTEAVGFCVVLMPPLHLLPNDKLHADKLKAFSNWFYLFV